MNPMRTRGLIVSLILLLSGVAAAQTPSGDFWSFKGVEVYGLGDSISVGDELWTEPMYMTQYYNLSDPLDDMRLSLTSPTGYYWPWSDHSPSVFGVEGTTAKWRSLDETSPMMIAGMDIAAPTSTMAADINITRSIPNPIFTSDNETRSVTVTLDIPAGAMTGRNWLEVHLLGHDLPNGMNATVSNIQAPSGFWTFDRGAVLVDPAVENYAGQYTFTGDVTFQRSGDLSQAAIGDYSFKPACTVMYGSSSESYVTSDTVSTDFGNGYVAQVEAPTTVNWRSEYRENAVEYVLPNQGADVDASMQVEELLLFKQHWTDFTGQDGYSFEVNAVGHNVQSGTLVTPTGQVHELWPEEDNECELFLNADSDQDLLDLGFTNGQYTLTLHDGLGNSQPYTLTLDGDYPSEMPNILSATNTVDQTPTVEWQSPTGADIDALIVVAENDSIEYFNLYQGSDIQTIDEWTAPAPVDPFDGMLEVDVDFFQGSMDTSQGYEEIVGYLNMDFSYLSIHEPEDGDCDIDGDVDATDLATLGMNWEPGGVVGTWETGDFDEDGDVDATDLARLGMNWSPDFYPLEIPEPATLSFLVMGGLAMIRKRR